MSAIPMIGFAAYSGTGKTTLIEKLILRLKEAGLRLAVIKHDAHGFDIDHEGKDTWRFTKAGSDMTIIASAQQTACIEQGEKPFNEVAALVHDVDLILVEGYKRVGITRIGICREATGKGFTDEITNFAAIVTDIDGIESKVPCFRLDDIDGVAEFILGNMTHFTHFDRKIGIIPPCDHAAGLEKAHCSAIVLAGGRGSRMGGLSKAELMIGDVRFMDHLAQELSGFGQLILSTNDPNMAEGTPFLPVADAVPGMGPLGGICAALQVSQHRHAVVTACDMPWFRSSLAEWLLGEYANEDILICRTNDGRLHPLCGIYTKGCLPVLEENLSRGHLKITKLLEEVNCRILDVPKEFQEQFTNVNTPEDLKRVDGHINK